MTQSGVPCTECSRIATALRDASQSDRRALRGKLRDVAESSYRDVRQLGVGWVFSVAAMPDDEMEALQASHYPHVAQAKRHRAEHERASGHSVSLHAMWTMSLYGAEDSE